MSSLPEPADVIASKSANIMTEFGDLSNLAKASLILSDGGTTLLFYEALKKFYGGTWVGGTAALTKAQLSFKPSALNILLPGGKDPSVTVPLDQNRQRRAGGRLYYKNYSDRDAGIDRAPALLRCRRIHAEDSRSGPAWVATQSSVCRRPIGSGFSPRRRRFFIRRWPGERTSKFGGK
jgi:hypothetical protein